MTWDFGRFVVAGVISLDPMRPLVRLMARARRLVPWYEAPGVVRLAACGVIFAGLAGVWFSGGDLLGAIIGSLALFVVLLTDATLDMVRDRSEVLDPWMTGLLGHVRELPVLIGVGLGGVAAGFDHVWLLAAVTYGLHGVRESVRGARWVQGREEPATTTIETEGLAAPPSPTRLTRPTRPRRMVDPSVDPVVVRLDPSRPRDPGRRDATLTTELLRGPVGPRPRRSRLARWCGSVTRPVRSVVSAGVRRGSRLRAVGQRDRFALIALTTIFGNAIVTFIALGVLAVLATVVEFADPEPTEGTADDPAD
ncbi:hypothetical protein J4H86_12415 [Spiractinospora alimapuensis]|uniref:hypothetical protein n=1 Tax=Spiractinospora alimapuensis TaxID=2820884 RepID=UPI001F362E1B|nr:hypothetical protein [Spiractinospora alimapuensis]QVQ54402.1 hypothetical protein J4H86_12415 [Spiractinospora alimapuensis]